MAFDPNAHLRKIRTRQGQQDYLDVKWRIIWLREDHPDVNIVTECIEQSETHARFKCTISYVLRQMRVSQPEEVDRLVVMGTGHGSETQQDFPDFYEKAETKSVGRACAMLGYGTDTAIDFDDSEPMDGYAASKEARAERHEEVRQAADDQHARNVQQGQAQPARQPPPQAPAPSAQQNAPRSADAGNGNTQPQRTQGQATGMRAMREAAQHEIQTGSNVGITRSAEDHLRSIAGEGTQSGVPAKQAVATTLPNTGDKSNIHQHAQLETLRDNGVDIDGKLEEYGVKTIEELTREQAKEVIIWGRQNVNRS